MSKGDFDKCIAIESDNSELSKKPKNFTIERGFSFKWVFGIMKFLIILAI